MGIGPSTRAEGVGGNRVYVPRHYKPIRHMPKNIDEIADIFDETRIPRPCRIHPGYLQDFAGEDENNPLRKYRFDKNSGCRNIDGRSEYEVMVNPIGVVELTAVLAGLVGEFRKRPHPGMRETRLSKRMSIGERYQIAPDTYTRRPNVKLENEAEVMSKPIEASELQDLLIGYQKKHNCNTNVTMDAPVSTEDDENDRFPRTVEELAAKYHKKDVTSGEHRKTAITVAQITAQLRKQATHSFMRIHPGYVNPSMPDYENKKRDSWTYKINAITKARMGDKVDELDVMSRLIDAEELSVLLQEYAEINGVELDIRM